MLNCIKQLGVKLRWFHSFTPVSECCGELGVSYIFPPFPRLVSFLLSITPSHPEYFPVSYPLQLRSLFSTSAHPNSYAEHSRSTSTSQSLAVQANFRPPLAMSWTCKCTRRNSGRDTSCRSCSKARPARNDAVDCPECGSGPIFIRSFGGACIFCLRNIRFRSSDIYKVD